MVLILLNLVLGASLLVATRKDVNAIASAFSQLLPRRRSRSLLLLPSVVGSAPELRER